MLGSARFVLEVCNGMQPLAPGMALSVVKINFLHYALYMFLICTAVLIGVSLLTTPPPAEKLRGLTFATASDHDAPKEHESSTSRMISVLFSVVLVLTLLYLWWHFR